MNLPSSRCELLRRSKNHRENAPRISDGAKFDVGDIEKSMASAEICSIGAENSAPALPGAQNRAFLPRARRFCSVSRCELLPRSKNHRENAPGISGGAKFDVDDIEKSITSAEICSMR